MNMSVSPGHSAPSGSLVQRAVLSLDPGQGIDGAPWTRAVRRGLSSVTGTIQSLNNYRNVAAYLAARMIYNDGLNVMLAFGGIYAAGVFHWGAIESALYGILLSVFAAIGGLSAVGLPTASAPSLPCSSPSGARFSAHFFRSGFAPDRLFFCRPLRAGNPHGAVVLVRTAPPSGSISQPSCSSRSAWSRPMPTAGL